MAVDAHLTIAAQSESAEWESPAVSLQEAAQRLGLTESEVLLRVFRGSLPSVPGDGGGRRVPLAALDALAPAEDVDHSDDLVRISGELARMTAHIAAVDDRLRDANARIAELESRERQPSLAEGDRVDMIAGELRAARARIAALESERGSPRAAQIKALDGRLRDAYARIAELESREPQSSPAERDRLDTIADDLRAARARIAALESERGSPPPPWLRRWEACCRWLNFTT